MRTLEQLPFCVQNDISKYLSATDIVLIADTFPTLRWLKRSDNCKRQFREYVHNIEWVDLTFYDSIKDGYLQANTEALVNVMTQYNNSPVSYPTSKTKKICVVANTGSIKTLLLNSLTHFHHLQNNDFTIMERKSRKTKVTLHSQRIKIYVYDKYSSNCHCRDRNCLHPSRVKKYDSFIIDIDKFSGRGIRRDVFFQFMKRDETGLIIPNVIYIYSTFLLIPRNLQYCDGLANVLGIILEAKDEDILVSRRLSVWRPQIENEILMNFLEILERAIENEQEENKSHPTVSSCTIL
ncbi:unnamed protein product [Rodentolepis nana]|uniref:G domain-containing protein n=1 Tax=Rodentolepis nana TaxID=102285 RepID=A0A0R3TEU3_RODNA|nr:unnamed protein product [Rodentolepis nana]